VAGPDTVYLLGSNQYQAAALVITNGGRLVANTLTLASTRPVTIAAGSTLSSTGTVYFTAPPGGDTTMVGGPGGWELDAPNSSLTAPDLFYSPEGLLGNYGVRITAPIDTGATGTTRYIRGNSNRNDFYRYYGDWQEQGGLTGGADLYFYGVAQGAYEMTFTLWANNSAYTGDVTLQRGDLVLYHNQALTAGQRRPSESGPGRECVPTPLGQRLHGQHRLAQQHRSGQRPSDRPLQPDLHHQPG
jgi:hypothetical protein